MNIHTGLFSLGLILILLEVYHGWALGFFLASAVTCFLVGVFEWGGLVSSFSGLVITGSFILPICIYVVIKLFKNSIHRNKLELDNRRVTRRLFILKHHKTKSDRVKRLKRMPQ